MQPKNNEPNYDNYSIDYLNQISKPSQQHKMPKRLLLVIGGGVLFLLIILILGLALQSGPKSTTEKATDLYFQLQVIKEVAGSQQKELRSNELRNYNSALNLQLANALDDLTTVLASEGIDTADFSKEQEAGRDARIAELKTKFEEAALNIQLDRTYAREMAYQLDIIASMITAIKNKDSQSVAQFVENNEATLQDLSTKFNEFSDS